LTKAVNENDACDSFDECNRLYMQKNLKIFGQRILNNRDRTIIFQKPRESNKMFDTKVHSYLNFTAYTCQTWATNYFESKTCTKDM
jgi:hypothetical protein